MLISNRQERSPDTTNNTRKPTLTFDPHNSRETERKQVRTQLLLHARKQHPSQFQQQLYKQDEQWQSHQHQLQTLQTTIRQLNLQLTRLNELNQGLISRIKQIETQYSNLKTDLEQKQVKQNRKLKYAIYNDVEHFIRDIVQRMAVSLKQERPHPALQRKIERFMVEILEINVIAVEKKVRQSKEKDERTLTKALLAHQHFEESPIFRSKSPDRQKYSSVMQRLTAQPKSRQPQFEALQSRSQEQRTRFVYATTPQKRRRIFQ